MNITHDTDALISSPGAVVQVARYRHTHQFNPVNAHFGHGNSPSEIIVAPGVITSQNYVRFISLFGISGDSSFTNSNVIERGRVASSNTKALFVDRGFDSAELAVAELDAPDDSVSQTIALVSDHGSSAHGIDAIISPFGDAIVQVARYRHVNTSAPVHAHAGEGNDSSTTISTPAITTHQNFVILVSLFGAVGQSQSITAGVDQTQRAALSFSNIKALLSDEQHLVEGVADANSAYLDAPSESVGQILALSAEGSLNLTAPNYGVDALLKGSVSVNHSCDSVLIVPTKTVAYGASSILKGTSYTDYTVDALIVGSSKRIVTQSAFIYGNGFIDCNNFDTAPTISLAGTQPTYTLLSYDGTNKRLIWDMHREVEAGAWWTQTSLQTTASPYFSFSWKADYMDLEQFASHGGLRFTSAGGEGPIRAAGIPIVELMVDWDTDRVSARSVKGRFWNGSQLFDTAYRTISVGTTYSIKLWVDTANSECVLDVNGVESRVAYTGSFQGAYDRLSLPSYGGTTTVNNGYTESYAKGTIDSICYSRIVNPPLHSSISLEIADLNAVVHSVDALIYSTKGYEGAGLGSVGYGGGLPTSQLLTIRSSKPSFTRGSSISASTKSSYICGHGYELESQSAYIRSVGLLTSSLPAFIHGDRYATDSVRGAYIAGGNVGQHHVIFAPIMLSYINGAAAPTISSVKAMCIVSYGMIGDWNLNDGLTDPFKTTADDAALGNSMLFTNRSPIWVPGPHCEGEP